MKTNPWTVVKGVLGAIGGLVTIASLTFAFTSRSADAEHRVLSTQTKTIETTVHEVDIRVRQTEQAQARIEGKLDMILERLNTPRVGVNPMKKEVTQ